MNHDPKEHTLQAHANATWNVWTKHTCECTQCFRQPWLYPTPAALCLEGRAAHEEWQIAASRLDDHRRETATG